MADGVRRLTREDEPGIRRLLASDPVVNLFLNGFLAIHPVDRTWWYGIGAPVRAVVLVLPGRLAVPFGLDPTDGPAIGTHLRAQHAPCLLVGPRALCDGLWGRWVPKSAPRRHYDQRLYRIESPPAGEDPPGFRLANPEDAWHVVPQSAAMEIEDLGVDPRAESQIQHEAAVMERLKAGRTWVIAEDGAIVFQVNLGTSHGSGCQVGGTYVPVGARGRGLATAGIAATCRRLLRHHPRVTLHVNEANTPAVRAYERAGFVRDAAFRLIVP